MERHIKGKNRLRKGGRNKTEGNRERERKTRGRDGGKHTWRERGNNRRGKKLGREKDERRKKGREGGIGKGR